MNQQSPTSKPSPGVTPVLQSASLTVKQVAARLGVSISTVYRIKRVNGPFLFVPAGRRVLIDAQSFEVFLAKKRSQDSAATPASSGIAAQQPAPAIPVPTGTGQRELNIHWRGPSIVIFAW